MRDVPRSVPTPCTTASLKKTLRPLGWKIEELLPPKMSLRAWNCRICLALCRESGNGCTYWDSFHCLLLSTLRTRHFHFKLSTIAKRDVDGCWRIKDWLGKQRWERWLEWHRRSTDLKDVDGCGWFTIWKDNGMQRDFMFRVTTCQLFDGPYSFMGGDEFYRNNAGWNPGRFEKR